MATTGVVRVRRAADGARWQLVARNGRVIAQAATAANSPEAALEQLREISRLAADQTLTPQLRHPRSSVAWTWTATTSDGRTIAQGLRTYERYGTCLGAFRRFVGMVARAGELVDAHDRADDGARDEAEDIPIDVASEDVVT